MVHRFIIKVPILADVDMGTPTVVSRWWLFMKKEGPELTRECSQRASNVKQPDGETNWTTLTLSTITPQELQTVLLAAHSPFLQTLYNGTRF
jgi:hypothetical protein